MAKVHDVWILSEIDPFFGFSARNMSDEITAAKKANADTIVVHINSPGGSVFEGFGIYNMLKSSGLKTVAQIEGLCASIATLFALGCDEIKMAEISQWMIHNPAAGVQGDAEEMRKNADVLQKVQDQMMAAYVARTGKTEDEITAMMKAETWLSAAQAKEMGFIDEITQPLSIAALLKHTNTNMSNDKKGIAAKVKAGMDKLKELIASAGLDEPKAGSMKLRDNDTVLYWEGEEIVQGSTKMFTDAEMTAPAPEGDHVLEDGRMVTIGPEGVCVRVMEPEASSSADAQKEIDALKQEKADLEAKIQKMESDHLATVAAINAEIKKLQALGIGKEITAISTKQTTKEPKNPVEVSNAAQFKALGETWLRRQGIKK